MKFLYVTPLWNGFEDIICDGSTEAKGMPAFIQPLKKIIEQGHTVDFIISDTKGEFTLNIGVDWLKSSSFYPVSWKKGSRNRLSLFIKAYFQISKIVKENSYDFIYCHGSFGAIGNLVANKYHIPCGFRLYGTFLGDDKKLSNKLKLFIKHPLEYLSFVLRKEFLLVTNDGTKGDKVYKKLSTGNNFSFYFLLNGVNRIIDSEVREFDKINDKHTENLPCLIYPARIAGWKQQHLAIELLNKLNEQGKNDLQLVFAGHISEAGYYNYLNGLIEKYNLKSRVKFLGPINAIDLRFYYQESHAVLSFYKYSNLGNVVIEALSHGAIIVTLDDGSLAGIIHHGINGFLVEDMEQASNIISDLYENANKRLNILREARQSSKQVFKLWNERVDDEINIIYNSIRTTL